MRVTFNALPESVIRQLGGLTNRLATLQTQAASGQRLQVASDDPAAMRRVLALTSEATTLTQHQSNIARLTDQANASYSVLSGLKKISDRVGEIATLAQDISSPEELQIYSTEVTELIKQAAQLANTKHQDRYLFSGTTSTTQPFDITLDAAGKVTGVTYGGNANTAEVEVATGKLLSVLPVGANTTGTGAYGLVTDSRTGADFFTHLISLQDNLAAGNVTAIHTVNQPHLAADEQHLILQIAANGGYQNTLDAAKSLTADRLISLDELVSHDADADLAETIIRLTQTQTAYQAALQSSTTLMQTSLLNYLR